MPRSSVSITKWNGDPGAELVEVRRDTARAAHDAICEMEFEDVTHPECDRFKDALTDLRRALRRDGFAKEPTP